jgi:hypothetical protein
LDSAFHSAGFRRLGFIAFHALNRISYGVVFALAAGALIFWKRKTGWHPRKKTCPMASDT